MESMNNQCFFCVTKFLEWHIFGLSSTYWVVWIIGNSGKFQESSSVAISQNDENFNIISLTKTNQKWSSFSINPQFYWIRLMLYLNQHDWIKTLLKTMTVKFLQHLCLLHSTIIINFVY